MTSGERVKKVRKSLGLTLEKFGERIGLKRSALSHIENNINSLTDSNIRSICREFNVNYEWLAHGDGDMFIESDDELSAMIDRVMEGDNEYHKFLMKQLASLTDEQLETVRQLINIFHESNKD